VGGRTTPPSDAEIALRAEIAHTKPMRTRIIVGIKDSPDVEVEINKPFNDISLDDVLNALTLAGKVGVAAVMGWGPAEVAIDGGCQNPEVPCPKEECPGCDGTTIQPERKVYPHERTVCPLRGGALAQSARRFETPCLGPKCGWWVTTHLKALVQDGKRHDENFGECALVVVAASLRDGVGT